MSWMKTGLHAALAALMVLLPPSAVAADDEQAMPTFVRTYTVTLKPGAMPEYTALVKRNIQAHRLIESERYWWANSTVLGDVNTVTFGRWYRSWEAMDEPPLNAVAEAFGPDEAKSMAQAIQRLVAHTESGVWVMRPDLANPRPEGAPPILDGFLSVFQVEVAPFGNGAYEAYLAKSREATLAQAPDAHYMAYAPAFGAHNTYAFVTVFPSMADIRSQMPIPARIRATFGRREAERLLAARADVVREQEAVLNRMRPDLAYLPPEMTAQLVGLDEETVAAAEE